MGANLIERVVASIAGRKRDGPSREVTAGSGTGRTGGVEAERGRLGGRGSDTGRKTDDGSHLSDSSGIDDARNREGDIDAGGAETGVGSVRLYSCPACSKTYVSSEMDACSGCGGPVEQVPDGKDLGHVRPDR